MNERHLNILDCKILVRKYVLVAQPSRWRQRGERVVVQSPMLEISKNVTQVPVKRYNGEEENSVDFLLREDIEKDTSGAYERSQITAMPSFIEAHGVALFNSLPFSDFEYLRCDKFWLCIGSDTSDQSVTVPVINLRTWERGSIPIDQVCWYPKIQGPNNELWTPGGGLRRLKLEGSRNFEYFSYVVRQQSPVAASYGVAILPTKSVKIPANGSKVKDTRLLTSRESREFFERHLRFMQNGSCPIQPLHRLARIDIAVSPISNISPPTPPSSPELEHLRRQLSETHDLCFRAYKAQLSTSQTEGLCSRLLNLLPSYGGGYRTQYDSTNTLTYPHSSIGSGRQDRSKSSLTSTSFSVSADSSDEESVVGSSSYSETNSSQPRTPRCNELDTNLGAEILLEIFEAGKDRPTLSVTSPAIFNNTYSIHKTWTKNKSHNNPFFTNLCDQRNQDCKYNLLFRCRHFHPPPSKCNSFQCSSEPLSPLILPGTGQRAPIHEHCISRLSPFPAGAGECMLSNLPSRNHTCCSWAISSLEGKSVLHKRAFETSSLDEHQRKKSCTEDRSGMVDGRLGMRQSIFLTAADGFDVEGLKLFQEDLDAQVLLEAGRALEEGGGKGGYEELCEELGLSASPVSRAVSLAKS